MNRDNALIRWCRKKQAKDLIPALNLSSFSKMLEPQSTAG